MTCAQKTRFVDCSRGGGSIHWLGLCAMLFGSAGVVSAALSDEVKPAAQRLTCLLGQLGDAGEVCAAHEGSTRQSDHASLLFDRDAPTEVVSASSTATPPKPRATGEAHLDLVGSVRPVLPLDETVVKLRGQDVILRSASGRLAAMELPSEVLRPGVDLSIVERRRRIEQWLASSGLEGQLSLPTPRDIGAAKILAHSTGEPDVSPRSNVEAWAQAVDGPAGEIVPAAAPALVYGALAGLAAFGGAIALLDQDSPTPPVFGDAQHDTDEGNGMATATAALSEATAAKLKNATHGHLKIVRHHDGFELDNPFGRAVEVELRDGKLVARLTASTDGLMPALGLVIGDVVIGEDGELVARVSAPLSERASKFFGSDHAGRLLDDVRGEGQGGDVVRAGRREHFPINEDDAPNVLVDPDQANEIKRILWVDEGVEQIVHLPPRGFDALDEDVLPLVYTSERPAEGAIDLPPPENLGDGVAREIRIGSAEGTSGLRTVFVDSAGREWPSERAARNGPEGDAHERTMERVAPAFFGRGIPLRRGLTVRRWKQLQATGSDAERQAFVDALERQADALEHFHSFVEDVDRKLSSSSERSDSPHEDDLVDAQLAVDTQHGIRIERDRLRRVAQAAGDAVASGDTLAILDSIEPVDVSRLFWVFPDLRSPLLRQGRQDASAEFLHVFHERMSASYAAEPYPMLEPQEFSERLSQRTAARTLSHDDIERLRQADPSTPFFVRWSTNTNPPITMDGLLHASDVAWMSVDPTIDAIRVEEAARVDRATVEAIMTNDDLGLHPQVPFDRLEIIERHVREEGQREGYGGGHNHLEIIKARLDGRLVFVKFPEIKTSERQRSFVDIANAALALSTLNTSKKQTAATYVATTRTPDGRRATIVEWVDPKKVTAGEWLDPKRLPAIPEADRLAEASRRTISRFLAAGIYMESLQGLPVLGDDGEPNWVVVDPDSAILRDHPFVEQIENRFARESPVQ